jgi:hypothetical protein
MQGIAFEPPLAPAKDTAALRYAHPAKLFVRLEEEFRRAQRGRSPDASGATPSSTRTGLPILGALAGTQEALSALEVDDGPERWLDAIEQLRPELRLDRPTALMSLISSRGQYVCTVVTCRANQGGLSRRLKGGDP